ncbi:MAG: hypothetical protein DWQ02_20505 [Bacteroidetes bacterium]|nr:MAG: hypothetical protein DWQ02_20505 [Bacteroidota bacterium]
MLRKLLFILLFLLTGQMVTAQVDNISNLRKIVVNEPVGRTEMDSLMVFSNSVIVKKLQDSTLVDQTFFRVEGSFIQWLKPVGQPVIVQYRVMDPVFSKTYTHLDSTKLAPADEASGPIIYNPYDTRDDGLIAMSGLNYQGSFSRGLSFGNNQDLVLDSRFNLRMVGMLGDGIEITAAITDENLPIQAEGNTRQLKEFDKVFIQLRKDKTSLVAGDYELNRPDGYFMNYFKKLQGATFRTSFDMPGESVISTGASIAVSRGQFVRNNIVPQEGNQGPYKLIGKEGEQFIIVLAGTEKVWLNGQLLVRGLEDDYVIDYNQGEITFTPRRIINKDSRIIIEFEYADQRYLRSLYAVNTGYKRKNLNLYFNMLSQQDSKTSTGDIALTNEEKQLLSLAGDDPSKAVTSTLDTLEEVSPERVSYRIAEIMLSCNGQDSLMRYLVYSVNPDSTLVTARFIEVGQGNGNYILDTEKAANERVYIWVAPDPVTCEPLGNFEPVGRLVAPQQQQLMTLGATYDFAKNASVAVEMALSNNDINRFSELDAGDDKGMAGYATLKKDFFPGSDTSGWQITTTFSGEWVQEHFQALNPYRAAEFSRDWNLVSQLGIGEVEKASEQLLRGEVMASKAGWGSLQYAYSGFERSGLYDGRRHSGKLDVRRNGWTIGGQGNLLTTQELDRKTRFSRPDFRISKSLTKSGKWTIGGFGQREKSERFDLQSDSLLQSSFYFDRYGFSLESGELENFGFNARYTRRKDYAPENNAFTGTTDAEDWSLSGQWKWRRTLKVSGNLNYRQLQVLRTDISNDKPAATSLGRINLLYTPVKLKGAVRMNAVYELGSGQEPKQEFTYTEVPIGSGTHIWLDSLYNNDGVIQPNEMEIAPFQDQANYVLIRTFTNDYIRTDNVGLNQSLELSPKAVWFAKTGVRKFISRFATRSSLRIDRKTRESLAVQTANPFQLELPDSALVSVSSIIRNTLFFNQTSTVFNFQLGYNESNRRFVQTSGFEARSLEEFFFKSRWNINTQWSFNVAASKGNKISNSEFFNEKDYDLAFLELEPQLTWLPSKSFRMKIALRYRTDEDVLEAGGAAADQRDISVEALYRKTAKSSFQFDFSYIDVDFTGQPSSPVGFAILNGLQNGRNMLWNVSLRRQLSSSIQLNIGYEGRKTGTANIIHTGRAQVRAVF